MPPLKQAGTSNAGLEAVTEEVAPTFVKVSNTAGQIGAVPKSIRPPQSSLMGWANKVDKEKRKLSKSKFFFIDIDDKMLISEMNLIS